MTRYIAAATSSTNRSFVEPGLGLHGGAWLLGRVQLVCPIGWGHLWCHVRGPSMLSTELFGLGREAGVG